MRAGNKRQDMDEEISVIYQDKTKYVEDKSIELEYIEQASKLIVFFDKALVQKLSNP